MRLDPFALPVRFQASDAGADGRVRQVELHRERVIVRRAVAGMRMAVSLPVANFLGVAIRVVPPEAGSEGAVAIVLVHRDQALAVPLFTAPDATDVLAEWQLWGRVLGLPLLVADGESWRDPFPRLGALRVAAPAWRRRRRSTLKRRRPTILMRRKPGRGLHGAAVHRDEREIIARD